jgi:hypothetical protein
MTNNINTHNCCRPFVAKILCCDGIRDIFWQRERQAGIINGPAVVLMLFLTPILEADRR